MSSDSERPPQANMGHRHSLTIETNPLHLLPSNMRRFSHTVEMKPGSVLTKLSLNNAHLQETKEAKEEKAEEMAATEEEEGEKKEKK